MLRPTIISLNQISASLREQDDDNSFMITCPGCGITRWSDESCPIPGCSYNN